jgi:hypothetical protein
MSDESRTQVVLLTFARRGEEQTIRDALAALRTEIPDADLFAIGTPVSAPRLREAGVQTVITYGSGSGAGVVLREARSRRPAAAAVVYWGPRFGGHLKLEVLALLTGAKVTHRFAPGSDARSIGRLRLAWSVAAKCAAALLCAATAAALCGLAFICLLLSQGRVGGGRARRY